MSYKTITQKQRIFSLIIRLLDHKKLTELLKLHIGNYELPNEKTIKRWKNCQGIPKIDDTGTNAFYKKVGLEELILSLEKKSICDWQEPVIAFLNSHDVKISDLAYKKELFEIEAKFPREDFTNIKDLSNFDLPFYQLSQQQIFKFQQSLLTYYWSDEDIIKLEEKFLRANINNELWLFPVIELCKGNVFFEEEMEFRRKIPLPPLAFIDSVKHTRKNITDNPTFAINCFDRSSGKIRCQVSSYFRALYHCDRYYYHTVTQLTGIDKKAEKKTANMSYIFQWQEHLKNIALLNNYSNIEASIGGSCLFVYYDNRKQKYAYLLSNKVSEANGVGEKHVIPSFMLQPLATDFLVQVQELDYQKHVYRELLEEVFAETEFEPKGHHETIYDDVMQNQRIKDLIELLDKGEAEFHMTGLWLDFYRLRPEITSVLVIHDSTWVDNYLTNVTLGNWETIQGGLIKIYVDDKKTFNNILKGIPNSMCPPGIAALVNGIEKTNEILSNGHHL